MQHPLIPSVLHHFDFTLNFPENSECGLIFGGPIYESITALCDIPLEHDRIK